MAKYLGLIAIVVLLANSLAVLGLLGYGLATGRFDSQERGQYLATWRGQTLVAPTAEEKSPQDQQSPQQAQDKIAAAEQAREILTIELQRQTEQLRNMKATLDAANQKFLKDRQTLDAEKITFQNQRDHYENQRREEGFQKSLKIYAEMKPKYVKDEFMKMDDMEVVRFIAAMKPDTAKTILEQFKTPEEQLKRRNIMNLLEMPPELANNQDTTLMK